MALTVYGFATPFSLWTRDAGREWVTRVVTASSITIDGLTLSNTTYTLGVFPAAKMKALIYNADGVPNPTTLVAEGTEVVGAYTGRIFLPFASPVTIAAGTYFWGFHTDTTINPDRNGASGFDVRYLTRAYASGAVDPFGTPTGTDAVGITIFAVAGSGVSVAKAYELELLAYPPGVSVAKAYDMLLLQDATVAPSEVRQQAMIIT